VRDEIEYLAVDRRTGAVFAVNSEGFDYARYFGRLGAEAREEVATARERVPLVERWASDGDEWLVLLKQGDGTLPPPEPSIPEPKEVPASKPKQPRREGRLTPHPRPAVALLPSHSVCRRSQ